MVSLAAVTPGANHGARIVKDDGTDGNVSIAFGGGASGRLAERQAHRWLKR